MAVVAPPASILRLHWDSIRYFSILLWVLSLFIRDLRFTSWYRDAETNAAVGGREDSLHLVGLAVDVVTQAAESLVQWARVLGLDAEDEGTHVHLELDVRRLGVV